MCKKNANIFKIIAFLFGKYKYKSYICIRHLKKTIMKTKKYNRSEIMKEAWVIFKDYEMELSFAKCLKLSWDLAKDDRTFLQVLNVESVGTIQNILENDINSTESQAILKEVAEKSKGFQKDIAEKALKNNWDLSYKQSWCVAYEFKKVA